MCQRGTGFLRLILEVLGVWIIETKGKSHFSPPSFAVYTQVPRSHRGCLPLPLSTSFWGQGSLNISATLAGQRAAGPQPSPLSAVLN